MDNDRMKLWETGETEENVYNVGGKLCALLPVLSQHSSHGTQNRFCKWGEKDWKKKITSEPAQTVEFRSQHIFSHNQRQWCGHHTSAESDECLALTRPDVSKLHWHKFKEKKIIFCQQFLMCISNKASKRHCATSTEIYVYVACSMPQLFNFITCLHQLILIITDKILE